MVEKLRHKYELLKKIGAGGMAVIYLAKEIATGNKVAIKLMKQSRAKTYKEKIRFTQEIELLKKVESETIVKFIEGECTDDYQYIVMEHIHGETLSEYIRKRGSLCQEETVSFAKQLAIGFSKIHQAGIIHRDIKSSNIMVADHGQIKIIDFGIALVDDSLRVTATNSIIGSPQYIAPEMADGEEPSIQSDVYALGILMYEMLEGRPPFWGTNQHEVLRQQRNRRVPRLSRINRSVSEALSNIVLKATSKDLNRRHRDMDELYQDLSTVFLPKRENENPIATMILFKRTGYKDITNTKVFKLMAISLASLFVILIAVVITIIVMTL